MKFLIAMKYTEQIDKVSYCFGLSIASNLMQAGVKSINVEAFTDALTTAYAGQMPDITPEEANKLIDWGIDYITTNILE